LDILICLLIFQFIKKPDISSPASIELWKEGTGLLYFRLIIPLVYITLTIAILWAERDSIPIVEHKIRFLPIVFLITIVSLTFSTFKLQKKEKNAYRYFFTGKTDISEIKYTCKQFFRISLAVIILLNIFVEVIRGMWFFNFLTWILFSLILLFIWRFLENLFTQPLEDINKSEVNVDQLPSLYNPKFFLKTIIFHAIVCTICMVSLGLLIMFWKKLGP